MVKLEEKLEELVYNPGRIILWLIVIFATIYATKKAKGFLSGLFSKNYASVIETEDGSMETYPRAQYYAWADRMHAAMRGFGTDESTIYNVLSQLRTQADWVALVRAFGTKDKESLTEWLTGDLSESEISKVNKILSKVGVQI